MRRPWTSHLNSPWVPGSQVHVALGLGVILAAALCIAHPQPRPQLDLPGPEGSPSQPQPTGDVFGEPAYDDAGEGETLSSPMYRFKYYVHDASTGDYKTQEEIGENGLVRGAYTVGEPNGDLRVVTYTAGQGRGFQAMVLVQPGAAPGAAPGPAPHSSGTAVALPEQEQEQEQDGEQESRQQPRKHRPPGPPGPPATTLPPRVPTTAGSLRTLTAGPLRIDLATDTPEGEGAHSSPGVHTEIHDEATTPGSPVDAPGSPSTTSPRQAAVVVQQQEQKLEGDREESASVRVPQVPALGQCGGGGPRGTDENMNSVKPAAATLDAQESSNQATARTVLAPQAPTSTSVQAPATDQQPPAPFSPAQFPYPLSLPLPISAYFSTYYPNTLFHIVPASLPRGAFPPTPPAQPASTVSSAPTPSTDSTNTPGEEEQAAAAQNKLT